MFTEKFSVLDGQQIHYVEGLQNGPPLLVLHGAASRLGEMSPLVEDMATDWHVFACDLRGHGLSARAETYHITHFFSDTTKFLRTVIKQPTVLVGHSLGGLVSIGTAGLAPDMVRAIILLDPPLALRHEKIRANFFYNFFTGFYEYVSGNRSLKEVMTALVPEIDEVGIEAEQTNLDRVDPVFLKTLIEDQLVAGWDMTASLQSVHCPAMLLYGEQERGGVIHPADLPYFEAQLPGAHTRQISEAGHLLLVDRPAEALTLVKSFLVGLQYA